MNLSLQSKRALVCGSTDGIGKACSSLMAARGASIILAARNETKLKSTLEELEGDEHSYICADFDDPDDLKNKTIKHLAETGSVHILMNNTGGPHGGPLIKAQAKEFEIAFRRHIIANQFLVQAVVPGMKELGYGRIINIISTSVRQVIPGLGVSNTIRGAVAQWAKTQALELGPDGITTNNILPGYTNTERLKELLGKWADNAGITYAEMVQSIAKKTSLGRIGNPNEIASAVAFLASDAASYINGTNLAVDGGRFGT
ncbi:MAG TPA: SDR family oxidoreductase [Candidatus Marinimicrobia bacterium]|jgi:3-oxoacyl-[acyl-carrier protein] reductase|nr:short-chain dehydrogenase [Candidatus Neomarinimicrobiota bacterium]MDP6275501.1 SDR family oxidoreductase [Candidatus Neomarinimicrobiota bacterium]MDP7217775.1 SDR family oxidoreductase [Candidatus Neomarinimicrobiota bacterium]MDP7436502.1 SDR family oxidoreductase [Candidatus Neomarinimicrobiota bacterium]HBN45273.1 short-chain dehydrogenase [Candidatus Neomarinimicrobiota bacterium]|tara:strand:+ start:5846 stop:6622 length:777 start_codon:yes stop_codon:yes gene_type:complete